VLFDGSFANAKLDEALLRRYAGLQPEERPSVGA
jgi:hypothetical protein